MAEFVAAHSEATELINQAKAEPGSPEYRTLVELATAFTSRSEEVVATALEKIDYGTTVDFGIVAESSLADGGYGDSSAFAGAFVDPPS